MSACCKKRWGKDCLWVISLESGQILRFTYYVFPAPISGCYLGLQFSNILYNAYYKRIVCPSFATLPQGKPQTALWGCSKWQAQVWAACISATWSMDGAMGSGQGWEVGIWLNGHIWTLLPPWSSHTAQTQPVQRQFTRQSQQHYWVSWTCTDGNVPQGMFAIALRQSK